MGTTLVGGSVLNSMTGAVSGTFSRWTKLGPSVIAEQLGVETIFTLLK
jgi:hypothetical protein